ncbi:MAG TPA: 30S ribosomal protein THX [Cyclobacteriaceae bacterium]|nr:30S ribosomal protein THX [Cyclobacteriaceae bacterium]
MGKGDKKSKKGKIALGSYGNSRKRKSIKERLKRVASQKVVAPAAEPKAKRSNKKKTEA